MKTWFKETLFFFSASMTMTYMIDFILFNMITFISLFNQTYFIHIPIGTKLTGITGIGTPIINITVLRPSQVYRLIMGIVAPVNTFPESAYC